MAYTTIDDPSKYFQVALYTGNGNDDKSIPFIKITKEPYPQVLLVRKIIKDGSKYYGPFTDTKRLRLILKALYKIFQKHTTQNDPPKLHYVLNKKTHLRVRKSRVRKIN